MAVKIVLLDSSVLIDYFRKKDKSKTLYIRLIEDFFVCKISVITEYEIYRGATLYQSDYWDNFLKQIEIIPFDTALVKTAIEINKKLKKTNSQLAIADLFIAATAVENQIPCATLNKKHFERVENLEIIT